MKRLKTIYDQHEKKTHEFIRGSMSISDSDYSIKGMREIHRYLARNLTDNLDTVIGLPLNVEGYFNPTPYGAKMFKWICDHFEEMMKIINPNI